MIRVLLDNCVWGGVASVLRDRGWDVVAMADLGLDPGDAAIMAKALAESRILITLDKDFGDLVHVRRLAHPGIVRLEPCHALLQAERMAAGVVAHEQALNRGALVVLGRDRSRVRLADLH